MAILKKKSKKKKLTVKEKIIAMLCLLAIGASWTVIGVKAATTINPPVKMVTPNGIVILGSPTAVTADPNRMNSNSNNNNTVTVPASLTSKCDPKYQGKTIYIDGDKNSGVAQMRFIFSDLCRDKSLVSQEMTGGWDSFNIVSAYDRANNFTDNSGHELAPVWKDCFFVHSICFAPGEYQNTAEYARKHDVDPGCYVKFCVKHVVGFTPQWVPDKKNICGDLSVDPFNGEECEWDGLNRLVPGHAERGGFTLEPFDTLYGHGCADKKGPDGKPMTGTVTCNHTTCKIDYSNCSSSGVCKEEMIGGRKWVSGNDLNGNYFNLPDSCPGSGQDSMGNTKQYLWAYHYSCIKDAATGKMVSSMTKVYCPKGCDVNANCLN